MILRFVVLMAMAEVVVQPGVSQTAAQANVAPDQASSSVSPAAPSDGNTPKARRRANRRARRRYAPTATASPTPDLQTVAPDAAQRSRDAQILAQQKAQSAEIARQNAITTGNVVKEREAQQAEPRIQDAPGPGSQPLAGDPAVQPTATSETPRIQDAPGPAQTLPQAPPAQTPATQQTAPQK
ncbi:hypothetical protein HDF16_003093 [Granulicella aggregans]|uniref:Uncharacterized protein n=1 Tax=Granulicella aggregans TaxID=474949 RepID=A0A7W7ZEZ6_9BACT|nr:hypothetical protein [Granulicella aggregans]MBB5058379.1 hypothetical protein [Granulicella aggregans]